MDNDITKIIIKQTDIIQNSIEKQILKLLLKNKSKYFYNKLSEKEIKIIIDEINNINECVIKSIKSTYIKEQIIISHSNLKQNIQKIIRDYSKNNILKLSQKYNNSPLTILRLIFQSSMSKDKVKKIFKNPLVMNNYDYEQFNMAKDNDYYSVSSQKQMEEATHFEHKIEKFLIKNNIKYKTQEILSNEQIKQFGIAVNTPDFLITSNLIINNEKINWIDAKNFYGSNTSFVIKKIHKQIQKYISEYGNGCIIFSCGYNSKLKFNHVLLLSYNDLS
jgi:hypothetical protein